MLTQEEFEKQVSEKYGEKYSVVGTYINWKTPIELRCNRCNTNFTRIPNNITTIRSNICCPVCDNKSVSNSVVVGINDLWTTHPDVASMLENSENGHLFSAGSNKKAMFVCPKCHNIDEKSINDVVRRGYSCKYCGDGISYPNKFMANLLRLNNISYNTEFSFKGIKYRYDFHFNAGDKKYLLEMDGGYGHGCVDIDGRSIEQQLIDDEAKDRLAIDNGFEIIRIDCRYKFGEDRFLYVKNSILNSDLFKILHDLSDETLSICNNIASNSSAIVDLSNLWNNGIRSYDDFMEYFHISRPCVRKRLKTAIEIGLIDCDYKHAISEMRITSNKKLAHSKGSPIQCIETGKVFYSIAEAKRCGYTNIDRFLSGESKYAGTLPDGTKLTWKRITKEEALKYAS